MDEERRAEMNDERYQNYIGGMCSCSMQYVRSSYISSGESKDVALEDKLASFAKRHCRLGDLGGVEVFVFVGRDGGVQIRNESSYRQVIGVFICRAE